MLRRVQKYIRDNGLLRCGDRVLVCVSGGADSVALLDVLLRGGYDCVVAHCNFHLRGEESDRDMTFVENLVAAFAKGGSTVKLHVQHFDTTAYAKAQGVSIEVAARELRYTWFADVAAQEHCRAIAVAHHRNDQAETVVMNLRRGTGIRGLAGMRAVCDNAYANNCIPIIRPLLCTTRDYIEHYLTDIRHLDWVNDSTNTDTMIARNAIRAQLKTYSKAEIEHIAATAEYMQGYIDWLDHRDTRMAKRAQLYEQLRTYRFPQTDEIFAALEAGVGGKVFLSPTHKAEIRKGQLCITTLS